MPNEPTRGYPYPPATGVRPDVPYWLQQLAEAIGVDVDAVEAAEQLARAALDKREADFRKTAFAYYRAGARVYTSGLMDWMQDTRVPEVPAPTIGSFNTANGVWTCGATGLYAITAKIRYRSNAGGHLNYSIDFFGNTEARALLNGNDVALYVSGGNFAVGPVLSGLAWCTAGRGYKIRGWSDASSNTVEVGEQHSYFQGIRVA